MICGLGGWWLAPALIVRNQVHLLVWWLGLRACVQLVQPLVGHQQGGEHHIGPAQYGYFESEMNECWGFSYRLCRPTEQCQIFKHIPAKAKTCTIQILMQPPTSFGHQILVSEELQASHLKLNYNCQPILSQDSWQMEYSLKKLELLFQFVLFFTCVLKASCNLTKCSSCALACNGSHIPNNIHICHFWALNQPENCCGEWRCFNTCSPQSRLTKFNMDIN